VMRSSDSKRSRKKSEDGNDVLFRHGTRFIILSQGDVDDRIGREGENESDEVRNDLGVMMRVSKIV